jgi:hypothetical protein
MRFTLVIPAVTIATAIAASPVSAQLAPAPAAVHLLAEAIPLPQVAEAVPAKKVSEPVPRRGFNVVLLIGDMEASWGEHTVPVAARKALADMKDFLPYKTYRLADTQWVLASNAGPAIVRLRGWEEQDYELELRASPAFQAGTPGFSPTGMSVRFFLREADGPSGDSGRAPMHPKEVPKGDTVALEIGREIYQLERERDDLQLRVTKGRKDVEVGVGSIDELKRLEVQLAAVTRRLSDLKQTLSATSSKAVGRTVIDTSFRMDEGETVVVGTSKVKGGGKALIALLTATADRPKGSTK